MFIGLSSPGRAITYTIILLAASFVWGAVSANVKVLRNARSIPYLAHNWAVALPVFILWVVMSFVLARSYLEFTGGSAAEGFRLGVLFAVAAFLFDAVVVAGIVGEGWSHFAQSILWLSYALLVLIPWLVGRSIG